MSLEALLGRHFYAPSNFSNEYRAWSMAMLEGRNREDADKGGKLILPASALDQLTRLNISYPMLFSVENRKSKRITHCGVLEFVANEGLVHMPHWMMQNLATREGESVIIKNCTIPVAQYAKFQPQSPDFLNISNPKAVLENTLRTWACLTEGDIISITYNRKVYDICVLEVKPKDPSHAVSIIECDMELDFATPIGYVEPEKVFRTPTEGPVAPPPKTQEELEAEVVKATVFQPFTGSGNRLDGKAPKGGQVEVVPVVSGPTSDMARLAAERRARAAAAEARFTPGKLTFGSSAKPAAATISSEDGFVSTKGSETKSIGEKKGFVAFGGKGNSLR